MTIWAKISFEFEGTHRWKKAPAKVNFLKYPHRHIFKCIVWIEQQPEKDRDVEYIQVKEILNKMSGAFHKNIDESCETMALNILGFLSNQFPNRKYKIEVTEDGENGAFIE